jgi:homogentisate 1,2-dioxygenase
MELTPQKIMRGSMAFMFESSLMLGVSDWALKEAHVQQTYSEHSWGQLRRHFDSKNIEKVSNVVSNELDSR